MTAAAKTSATRITAMRIYVDNVSKYLVNASTLDTSLAIAAGTHNMVVQALGFKWCNLQEGADDHRALVIRVH